MNEEGKTFWQIIYNPEEKTFTAAPALAYQAWDEAELIDNEWTIIVEAGNKADAMQLGYNMIRAAICRQEAALKDIAQPEFEKAKAEQEQGPKWWDVCYSVHTKQYSVREAPFTLTGPQKDGEIEDDKGCYRIYVQALNKKMACVDADFRIGQYLLRLQTDMAYAVRRAQREYFFNDDEDKPDLTYHREEESQWKL